MDILLERHLQTAGAIRTELPRTLRRIYHIQLIAASLAVVLGLAFMLQGFGSPEKQKSHQGIPPLDSDASPSLTTNEEHSELHIVGVYEGAEAGVVGSAYGDAWVEINRPGKNVVLVLTSYHKIKWHVDVKDGNLKKVILGGYDKQKLDSVDDSVEVEHRYRSYNEGKASRATPPLPYFYKAYGNDFRNGLRILTKELKMDVASFNGAYSASKEAFKIDRVEKRPEFSPDYPAIADLSKLPELSFTATVNNMFTQSTLEGPQPDELNKYVDLNKALQEIHGIKKIVFSEASDEYYGIGPHQLYRFRRDEEAGSSYQVKKVSPPDHIVEISHASGITYDSSRKRVLLTTFGGKGFLYSYTPATDTWEVLSSLNNIDLHDICYNESSDTLIASSGIITGKRSNGLTLHRFNEHGLHLGETLIAFDQLPGILDTYDPDNGWFPYTQVAVDGNYVALLICPERGNRHEAKLSRIYLYDQNLEKSWLTYKED